mgnify:CR=1 FL=1
MGGKMKLVVILGAIVFITLVWLSLPKQDTEDEQTGIKSEQNVTGTYKRSEPIKQGGETYPITWILRGNNEFTIESEDGYGKKLKLARGTYSLSREKDNQVNMQFENGLGKCVITMDKKGAFFEDPDGILWKKQNN